MIRGTSLTFSTRGLLTLSVFISVVFLPWPFTAMLTLVSSFSIPLLPLAAGIFADTLYYLPSTHASAVLGAPLFTLYGAIVTGIAFFVRSRMKTGIIG